MVGVKRLKNIGGELGGAIKGFISSIKESSTKETEKIITANEEAEDYHTAKNYIAYLT